MNVSVFKRNFEWIVIVDYHAITFHQTFADAMRHASTQVRSANNFGAVTQNHFSLHDRRPSKSRHVS